jgi:predicted ThiF/HesA family dinucleotide-utilizing enzyme
MKRIFTLLVLALLGSNISFGQTVYRSITSGAWNANTTWEISTDGGTVYNPTTGSQVPTTNNSVIIQNGHTVNIPASITGNCLNLTINSGGVLTDNGLARSVRPGASSSGTAGTVASLTNNGTYGGATDQLGIELPVTCAVLTLTGNGVYNTGRIRAITGNSNNPSSATAGHANSAQLIVDRDINLRVANYAFSAPNSTVSATDVITFTINSGKTVFVTNASGRWENTLMSTDAVATGGIYTYNVNGTLDLSATTATSSFIPYSNASSAINVNINGIVKLGTSFKADTVNTSAGAISLTIGNGGLLDGTLTTSFNANRRGTASGNIFFVTTGTGAIKRTVGATDTEFPIGTSTTNFNGVIINNAGTSDAFTVSVKNTLDNPVNNATKIVTKQWTISEAVAGGSNATIKLSWVTADQAAGFNPAGTVVVARWTGSAWQTTAATVTGTGTVTDPYVATASGFTAFSPFIVANAAALPVSFAGAKAYAKEKGVQVEWSIATESNISYYAVERSVNGKDFSSIGIVESKGNNSSLTSYSFFDATPIAGTNYYRIKALDKDGSFKYTAIMQVNISKGKADVIIAPNPVRNNDLNVQLSGFAKGNYTVRVLNNVGQVVFTAQVAAENGSISQTFRLPGNIRTGVYTLQVAGNDINLNKKIAIE